jgi:hypothetical protein
MEAGTQLALPDAMPGLVVSAPAPKEVVTCSSC